MSIEEQEIAGASSELFVINFVKDKMTLAGADRQDRDRRHAQARRRQMVKTRARDTLKGRARVKRTMWSRRAQEYEAKINSGDIVAIAEVVRDLLPVRGPARAVLFRAAALRSGARSHGAGDRRRRAHG